MNNKLTWEKPVLHKISIGHRCNPAKPQINLCEAQGIPQQGTTCSANKVGLS